MKDDVTYWAAGFTLIGVMVIIGLCRINVKGLSTKNDRDADNLREKVSSTS